MLGIVLSAVLTAMLLAALPSWPYRRQWGYYPSGTLALILVVLLLLALVGIL